MSIEWWESRLYKTPESRNPVIQFFRELYPYINESSVILDVGAGTGEHHDYQLRGRCKEIVGVDLDPRVMENPLLDRGVVADVRRLPLEDNTFDLAFSVYVLEHINDPQSFVKEIKRVLKPGGHFLALTPNLFHYMPIIARLTPTSFHKWHHKMRGWDHVDNFPTLYRLNTRRKLVKHFNDAGFEAVSVYTIEVKPHYLTFSTPTFLIGAAYERLVNSSDVFSALRVNIICTFRKL
jgi:SAM-dependent methyltransferase